MKNYLLIALLFLVQSALAQVYVRNYEVESGDKRVGEIRASKHVDGTYEQYDVESDVYMTILFQIHVSYKVQATFKEGVLVSSSATVYLNGNVQNQVDVERTGNHYTVVADGHTTRIYEDITYSSAKLYFSKPENIKKVFSETSGILKTLTETADGKYRLKNPEKESEVNTYTFSSDQGLNYILIERSIFPDLEVKYVREPRPAEEMD